jgi:hypothetical protein
MHSTQDVWLVTGMPGAGKTTISAALVARFDHGVHIPGDDVDDMIVSGRVEPDGEPTDQAELQIALAQRNMCMLARSFGDAGFVPVIDWVVRDQPDLEVFFDGLQGRRVHIVVLEPGPDIRAIRKPDATERFSYLATAMERALREVGLHIDSGSNGVDATLDLILSHRQDSLIEAVP